LAAAPDADLVFAGRPAALELTRHLAPGAPRIELRKRRSPGLGELTAVPVLRRAGIGRALLLTPSFSSALAIWAAGIRERIGWAEQGRGLLLTSAIGRPPRGAMHLSDEFCQLAYLLGAKRCPPCPALPPQESARAVARELLDRRVGPGAGRVPMVALCPGVHYGWAKQWPVACFRQLRAILEEKGMGGVVIGGPGEIALGQMVLEGAGDRWFNLAGKTTLPVAAELLRLMDVAVCNDAGAMHLAAAVGTPVVAIFGATSPAWTGPRGDGHQVLHQRLDCAPCFAEHCERGDPPPCMAAIHPAEVAGQTASLVAAQAARSRRGEKAAAVFLDRDGTLCVLVPYLCDPSEAHLLPGAARALRAARQAGYKLVVVSNQAGIARGFFTAEDVAAVNAALQAQLEAQGTRIDRFAFCPHHPELTGECLCRKPKPGMLERAAEELGIDLSRSVMVGDTIEDLQAGSAAGCRMNILVRTGYGEEAWAERRAELPAGAMTAADLGAAIELFLDANQREAAADADRGPRGAGSGSA
jgi:lipopolysaccharide heptosyltransferase II